MGFPSTFLSLAICFGCVPSSYSQDYSRFLKNRIHLHTEGCPVLVTGPRCHTTGVCPCDPSGHAPCYDPQRETCIPRVCSSGGSVTGENGGADGAYRARSRSLFDFIHGTIRYLEDGNGGDDDGGYSDGGKQAPAYSTQRYESSGPYEADGAGPEYSEHATSYIEEPSYSQSYNSAGSSASPSLPSTPASILAATHGSLLFDNILLWLLDSRVCWPEMNSTDPLLCTAT